MLRCNILHRVATSRTVLQLVLLLSQGKELYMLGTDLLFRYDSELQAAAQALAEDNDYFLDTFAGAWVKLMNADRFSGPTGNVCHRCASSAAAQPLRAFVARGDEKASLSVQ